jgi:PPOX class probable F420-dependent enzyme
MEIPEKVRSKLESARVARLATVSPKGAPHLIPVCFVFDGLVFYSGIDRKPKRTGPHQLARITNIETTPEVALLVDEYDDDWERLWYVLVRGTGALVTEVTEHNLAVARLKAKYPQYAAGMLDEDAPVLRITPGHISSWGKL